MKFCSTCLSVSTRGAPCTSPIMFTENEVRNGVCLKRLFITIAGDAERRSSNTIRIPRRSDSSRTSETPSTRFVLMSSAIRWINTDLFTWKGISVNTILLRSCFATSSISPVACTMILPRPVVYALRIPSEPQMCAPVGKSGPLTSFIKSSTVALGSFVRVITASQISATLCGGMLVAIPTAMPDAPLTNRFGNSAGSTAGSLSD